MVREGPSLLLRVAGAFARPTVITCRLRRSKDDELAGVSPLPSPRTRLIRSGTDITSKECLPAGPCPFARRRSSITKLPSLSRLARRITLQVQARPKAVPRLI